MFTNQMNDWVRGADSGWEKVGSSTDFSPEEYEPGDIFLTVPGDSGHVFMWIGDHGGHENVIADASFSRPEKTRTASLRRYTLDKETGADSAGRVYDVWRYTRGPVEFQGAS